MTQSNIEIKDQMQHIFNEVSTSLVQLGYMPNELFMPLANFVVIVGRLMGIPKEEFIRGMEDLFDLAEEEELRLRAAVQAANYEVTDDSEPSV